MINCGTACQTFPAGLLIRPVSSTFDEGQSNARTERAGATRNFARGAVQAALLSLLFRMSGITEQCGALNGDGLGENLPCWLQSDWFSAWG